MAVKTLVQTFASFLGYKLPDSSGTTGTILDQMDDSMGGVSDGVDDVNSGLGDTNKELDKANKKAKELSGSLGIDELHTFGKSSDDSSSGKETSGSGGMTVDPKILNALKEWDYLFGQVSLKAKEISETIQEWLSNLGKGINENIFKPIQNSWNLYGASISGNIRNTFNDVQHILGGIFDVVAVKWKPFFQAASDLFFSLLDTASLVTSTISDFFKMIWDIGGKELFEGVADLATAFLELMRSVNDNFVKPFIKVFKSTLSPIIASFVGVALNLIGKLLKAFSEIISWIAKCKPLVMGLGGAFTAMFLTIKVAKFAEFITLGGGVVNILKNMFKSMANGNGVVGKLFSSISSLRKGFELANGILVQYLAKLGLVTIQENVADGTTKILAASNLGLAAAEGTATGAAGLLGTALNFLSAHPLISLMSVIGLVVGALALFGSSQEEATYDMEDYSQGIQDTIKDLQDMRSELDETANAAKDSFDSKMADIDIVKDYLSMLREMSGESGYVKNISKAEFLVGKINELLPETVELTKDGKVKWLETADAIQKNIDKLEKKAELEAYSALYTEAIKAEIKARQTLAIEEENLNNLLKERNEIQDLIANGKATSEDYDRFDQLKADIDGTNKAIEEAKKTLDSSTKSIDINRNAIKNATNENDKFKNSYSKLTDEQSQSFNTLGIELENTKALLKDYADGNIKLDEAQVKSANEAKKSLIDGYAERAVQFGSTYETMRSVLEKQGITLTKEEEKQLKDSYDRYTKSFDEKSKIFKEQSETLLTMYMDNNKGVFEEEQKSYTDMLNALNQYGVNVVAGNSGTYERVFALCKKNSLDMTTAEGRKYAMLLNLLESNGTYLEEEQSSQYSMMLDALVKNNIDINSVQGKQYANMLSYLISSNKNLTKEELNRYAAGLKAAQEKGSDNGKAYIDMIKSGISSKDITPEMLEQWKNGDEVFRKKILVKLGVKDLNSYAKTWLDTLNEYYRTHSINLTGEFYKVKDGEYVKPGGNGTYSKYATGGFPSIGQMFIAREAGPELVGRMGSRNVVANNNQIVAGIEGGVANGFFRAINMVMGQRRSGGGNDRTVIENHIHLEVDGKELAEVIDEVKSKDGFDFGMGRK